MKPSPDDILLADEPKLAPEPTDELPLAPEVQPAELLARYQAHRTLQALAAQLAQHAHQRARLEGPLASQRAFILAAALGGLEKNSIVVLEEREAALYLQNDLELLLPDKTVLVYPATSKRPYQVDTIENANLVERAEVLHQLASAEPGQVLVLTYPEALAEKVIERQTLVKQTLEIKKGEAPGMEFISEALEDYGFEQTDFVYEPGQYAVRGGIIDLYAYNSEQPYRLEFLDDEIESIRTFEPADQLSTGELQQIAIIPNVRTNLQTESRVSLLQYLSPETLLVLESLAYIKDELEKVRAKAEQIYQGQQSKGDKGGDAVLEGRILLQRPPEELFIDGADFEGQLEAFSILQLGKTDEVGAKKAYTWGGSHQPSFKKEFSLLASHLRELQETGTETIIACGSPKQQRRLTEVLHKLLPNHPYKLLPHSLAGGFQDAELHLAVYTDHQIFERYHRYKVRTHHARSQALTMKELLQLQPGDFVTHVNHGIGRFAGLERIQVGEHYQDAVKILFRGDDALFVNVSALHKISKYAGKEGAVPKLNKLGGAEWARTTAKVKRRVKELAFDLVALYAKRKTARGMAYPPDSYLQAELEASFLYEDTPDQAKATEDVKADMEAPHPMDRLVCGDVGFGKTEIAIRAAYKAAEAGKQVAVLVPTTILALQHAQSFAERLEKLPVRVEYINRLKSKAEQTALLKQLAEGKVDIIIGTHRLLSKDVQFKDLGLLVIDEEHKFGVGAKEKLRLLKANVDTLTLTATPIPRTLQFSLLGIRDLSIINTPPPNRKPVETVVTTFESALVRDVIAYELKRKGQVFFVNNRIKDLEEIGAMIKKLVPEARIAVAHGQLKGPDMERIMLQFIEGQKDVLVCTTIIESGLDIPNANTIIINQAHMYGLSDLHQMRGRVGRSNRKAFAYLLAPPMSTLPSDSRKRLQAIEQFTELGSGLQLAMRDLDIRGAGDILGAEQSGFISEVGYDLFHKILEEAIRELKEEHFTELHAGEPDEEQQLVDDTQVDSDQEVRIPAHYVPNTAERLSLYKRISDCTQEEQLLGLQRELIDRFGLIPGPTLALFDTIRIRERARGLGFVRVVLREGVLRAYFPPEPGQRFTESAQFQGLLGYVQRHPDRLRLKQVRDSLQLRVQGIQSLKEALSWFRQVGEELGSKV